MTVYTVTCETIYEDRREFYVLGVSSSIEHAKALIWEHAEEEYPLWVIKLPDNGSLTRGTHIKVGHNRYQVGKFTLNE